MEIRGQQGSMGQRAYPGKQNIDFDDWEKSKSVFSK
jgi:hypothetical protein